jgi:hypothetical protein
VGQQNQRRDGDPEIPCGSKISDGIVMRRSRAVAKSATRCLHLHPTFSVGEEILRGSKVSDRIVPGGYAPRPIWDAPRTRRDHPTSRRYLKNYTYETGLNRR